MRQGSPIFNDHDLYLLLAVFTRRREGKALLLFLRQQYGLSKTTIQRRAYRCHHKMMAKTKGA